MSKPTIITKVCKRRQRTVQSDGMWGGLRLPWLTLHREGGHEPINEGRFLKLEKGKETDSFMQPPEGNTALLTPYF